MRPKTFHSDDVAIQRSFSVYDRLSLGRKKFEAKNQPIIASWTNPSASMIGCLLDGKNSKLRTNQSFELRHQFVWFYFILFECQLVLERGKK